MDPTHGQAYHHVPSSPTLHVLFSLQRLLSRPISPTVTCHQPLSLTISAAKHTHPSLSIPLSAKQQYKANKLLFHLQWRIPAKSSMLPGRLRTNCFKSLRIWIQNPSTNPWKRERLKSAEGVKEREPKETEAMERAPPRMGAWWRWSRCYRQGLGGRHCSASLGLGGRGFGFERSS